jgi:hypothetical protein
MKDPFKNANAECPWQISVHKEDGELKSVFCLPTKMDCTEEGCAPFYWAEELDGRIWVDAEVRIRRD